MAKIGKSQFDGGVLGMLGVNILTSFVTAITFGIAYPWMLCYRERWFAKHTKIDGRQLTFDGGGMGLIGSWIKWILLIIITIGIYGLWVPLKIQKWTSKHTYFSDSGKNPDTSDFTGGLLGFLGMNIAWFFLTILSIGIALPWLTCWYRRWISKYTTIEGNQLAFLGTGLGLFGNYIKWVLLIIITIGIYSFWVDVKMAKWGTENTTFVNNN